MYYLCNNMCTQGVENGDISLDITKKREIIILFQAIDHVPIRTLLI